MTNTIDFITELFFKVDNNIDDKKHPQAKLYPSEVVTIGLLYALKGCGQRNFWRWLTKDYRPLFLPLPCRTRLFRLLNSHRHYIECFLADPSILGVIDSYGIELLHPIREGRSDKQIGKKGKSNKRWIVDCIPDSAELRMALFNILVQWHGFQPDENGFVHLSIAEFSL